MCEGGPPVLSLGRLAELCMAIRMFEWAPSTLLTRFAEELRRALERGLLTSRAQRTERKIGYWRLGLGSVRTMRAGLPAAIE